MASHAQVAARVRRDKEEHPERFCPDRRCLWRTGGGYCPRHAGQRVVGRGTPYAYPTTRNEPTGE